MDRSRMLVRLRWLVALLAASVVAGSLLAGPAGADDPDPDRQQPQEIYGGYYPAASAWPWVAALINTSFPVSQGDFPRDFCTGMLIAPDRVLTAAHCVVYPGTSTIQPVTGMQTLVGRKDLRNVNEGERRTVVSIAIHPNYYGPTTGEHTNHAFYDAAVLFLDRPVTTIEPAVIGTANDWASSGTAMGWGHVNQHGQTPDVEDPKLRAADFLMLTDAQCAERFNTGGQQHFFPTVHVCADNAAGTSISCITHGDSGGPLMVRRTDGSWRLIGITSFYPYVPAYTGCGGAGGPFGFAWIAGPAMSGWPLSVPRPQPASTPQPRLRIHRKHLTGYVRYMIQDNTNGRIKQLRKRCVRRSDTRFRCRVSFRIRKARYSGAGPFYVFRSGGQTYFDYDFRGVKRPGKVRIRWQ